MRKDPVEAVATRPWPPLRPAELVDGARALLLAESVLAIVGPVGSGRGQLATELAELVSDAPVTRHGARHGEQDLPFFALDQLFAGVDPGADRSAVERSVLAALTETSAGRPSIVLADADLCDPESIEVLVGLAGAGRLRLIATLTPQTVEQLEPLTSAGGLITIPRLDEPAIIELLRTRFGADPHPLVTELLLETSRGWYAVVRDLVDSSVAAGAILQIEGTLVLDPKGQQTGAGRLTSRLSPSTAERLGGGRSITDLVHLTALLGGLDLEEARACVGTEVVGLAVAHGGLEVNEDVLVFSLPAEGQLALHTMPQDRRIELFDRFAAQLQRSIARQGAAAPAADWWRAAGRLLPVDLAGRAAREANLLGDYRRALVFSDPAANDQSAMVAPMERVFALHELGDEDGLLAVCVALDPAGLSEDELLPYLRSIRQLDDDVQVGLHERAVTSDDPDRQRSREAVRTLAELAGLAFQSGGDKLISRLRSLAFSAQLSPGNRAVSFAALAAALRHSARPVQAVESATFALDLLADRHESVSAYQLDLARELHILSLASALDVTGSEQAMRAYSSGLFASAGSGRLTTALQAHVAMVRGDMAVALASARLYLRSIGTLDPHQLRGWVEAMAAESLVHLGRTDDAHDALAEAKQHPSAVPQIDLIRRTIIAACHDAMAEPEVALEILSDVIYESRQRTLLMAQIDAAATSVLIDGPPQVEILLEAVDPLDEPAGTPLFWQAFARSARDYDIAAIVDLADELAELGAHLFAARIAQFVLDMARRATDLQPRTREHLLGLADLTVRRG